MTGMRGCWRTPGLSPVSYTHLDVYKRQEIHVEPSALGHAAHELSRVPQAGAQNLFQFQFTAQTQAGLLLGREESWLSGL